MTVRLNGNSEIRTAIIVFLFEQIFQNGLYIFCISPYILFMGCSMLAHGPLMGCSILALCSLYAQGHELGMSWA